MAGTSFARPSDCGKAQYQPLSRPLFIYQRQVCPKPPVLKDFVDFYIEKAPMLVSSVGYVPLPAEGYLDNVHFNRGRWEQCLLGKPINLTIGELLRKQAKF